MSGTIDIEAWADRLMDVAGGQLRARLMALVVEQAQWAEGEAKENATISPRVRTGTLRRSIAGTVSGSGDQVVLRLAADGRTGGSDVPYAAIQELGGVITPKKGKYLAIPLGAALTPSGVARGGPRDFANLRFVPGRGGSAWLVRDAGRGKTARSEVMFKLVRRVEIRPKRYMGRAFDELRARFPAAVGRAIGEILPGGGA